VKRCSWKLWFKRTKFVDNCALVDELLATQQAHFRLTVAAVLLIEMAAAAGRGPVPAGRGPGPVLTDAQIDTLRMVTALVTKLEIPRADISAHPTALASQKAAILRWNGDFVHFAADAIDELTCNDPGAGSDETDLQMAHELQLRALLSCCHKLSHKKRGGISTSAPQCTLTEFKEFRATHCDPAQPIVPWWKMTAKSEGLSNWNKSTKPNARDFKPFREMNLWIEHEESFLGNSQQPERET